MILIWWDFCSFTRTTIKFLLNSLPSLLTSQGWSISASNTEANSAAFIMRWGEQLNFAIPQGDSEKFYSYSRGITKNLQNLKNFQSPPSRIIMTLPLKAI